MRRRDFLKGSLFAGLTGLSSPVWTNELRSELPILVAVELSGGNDGLNTVVPYGNDEYYRQRPTIGIRESRVLALDDYFGLNPGMSGFKRLWDGLLAYRCSKWW